MKKELYDEKEIPNERCVAIQNEVYSFLFPLITKYVDEGYSVRDLNYVMLDVAKRVEVQFLLSSLNLENLKIRK
jgi:hypothetical protein